MTSIVPDPDRWLGCVFGVALGDTLGAPHEGGPLEKLLWRMLGRTSDGHHRWTDDTQMTLDLAESLLACGELNQNDMAQRFAASYSWKRGYGPSAAKLLKRIQRGQHWQSAARAIYKNGSYGNGAAMRAHVLALYFVQDFNELLRAVQASAEITHGHRLGIEGAILIAVASRALLENNDAGQVIARVRQQCRADEFASRLNLAERWLNEKHRPTPQEIVRQFGNGITAATSCVTALFIALMHLDQDFLQMMDYIIACGGDVDTLGAMAGGLWGISNGLSRLPQPALALLEDRARLEATARRLYDYAEAALPLRHASRTRNKTNTGFD